MAGVLSRAAGHLRSTFSPAIRVTYLLRPSAYPTGPRASVIPRLVHTEVVPTPRLPSWAREEVRAIVKEAVDAELKEVRVNCWERYQDLSAKHIIQSELAATRHGEVMTKLVSNEEKMAQRSFRVCVSMVGLALASQYQGQIAQMLKKIVGGGGGGDPPSQQEVATTVEQEVTTATTKLEKEIPHMIKTALAEHFLLEQQKREDAQPKG